MIILMIFHCKGPGYVHREMTKSEFYRVTFYDDEDDDDVVVVVDDSRERTINVYLQSKRLLTCVVNIRSTLCIVHRCSKLKPMSNVSYG